ncbi:hypothetical protein [Deinococcus maricopensis]|uniref:Uncharacterized protein n=1 Tax=Deinococcus maricopensis (strain DSM 21211 / LMG 22137 / NRRL B-23946 / LB-34) TaxID=709986 RepID=E8UA38_DEIML|nr:hypothetical protein [Deinococcus maricopensis]ADV67927.1 hypothetical protein Deima_2289 [Deinococcus maricopensis DSM 21211]
MRRAALLLTSALAACAPVNLTPGAAPTYAGPLTPRPPGTPDVLILGVSGHCSVPCDPAGNWDYLTPRGTLAALADTLRAQGLQVETRGYSARLVDHSSPYAPSVQRGFLSLERDLLDANRDLVWGRRNPTRIVLVAHSHGSTWTHQLTRLHPEVPVRLMIDLDSICLAWQTDNMNDFRTLSADARAAWSTDPAFGCSYARLGNRTYRVKDLVWPNVRYNLEVQSKRLPHAPDGSPHARAVNVLFESTPNVRTDGTHSGLRTYVSPIDDHSAVAYPNSDAGRWLAAQLPTLDWTP